MNNSKNNMGFFKLNHGTVHTWTEQGSSIMIKAVMGNGDPVELTAEEATELAEKLLEFARIVE